MSDYAFLTFANSINLKFIESLKNNQLLWLLNIKNDNAENCFTDSISFILSLNRDQLSLLNKDELDRVKVLSMMSENRMRQRIEVNPNPCEFKRGELFQTQKIAPELTMKQSSESQQEIIFKNLAKYHSSIANNFDKLAKEDFTSETFLNEFKLMGKTTDEIIFSMIRNNYYQLSIQFGHLSGI